MGHIDVQHVTYSLPDGRVLLDDVSFRIGEGVKAALVGANGAGKTTLMKLIAGDIDAESGSIVTTGGMGVMRQFIGQGRDGTVRDLLLSVSPPPLRSAAAEVDAVEELLMSTEDADVQMRYAQALADFADVGGYDAEVAWDVCCTAALGAAYDEVKWRRVETLSGGEQKRLVLEALLRGPDEVLLLDEPDNYLDVPGKTWLEERIASSAKTILLISHDRELLRACATTVVTVELGAAGNTTWVHGGGFATYADARDDRMSRLEELRRRWDEQHQKIKDLVQMLKTKAAYNDGLASRYQAAQTRLRMFEEAGPPEAVPVRQRMRMRLEGGRTAKRAIVCEGLELTDLTRPFDLEVWFGERVGVVRASPTCCDCSQRAAATRMSSIGPSPTYPSHRCATPASPGWARACDPDGSPRRTCARTSRTGPCWRSSIVATATATGWAVSRPRVRWIATASPPRGSSGSRRCPEASRRASRSFFSSSREPRCCSWTSPRTTWTWRAPRRSRPPSTPSRAPCWRSRTIGGSPEVWTGSSSSGETGW
jgi:ABC-type glutathione transport system ATPase component